MIPIGINEVINVAKNELLNKAKSMDKVSKDFKELDKPINNFTKGCENRATNETDGQQDAKKANKMKDTQNPEKKQSRESEANEKDNVDTKSNNGSNGQGFQNRSQFISNNGGNNSQPVASSGFNGGEMTGAAQQDRTLLV